MGWREEVEADMKECFGAFVLSRVAVYRTVLR
jgi:hypothetical protein